MRISSAVPLCRLSLSLPTKMASLRAASRHILKRSIIAPRVLARGLATPTLSHDIQATTLKNGLTVRLSRSQVVTGWLTVCFRSQPSILLLRRPRPLEFLSMPGAGARPMQTTGPPTSWSTLHSRFGDYPKWHTTRLLTVSAGHGKADATPAGTRDREHGWSLERLYVSTHTTKNAQWHRQSCELIDV